MWKGRIVRDHVELIDVTGVADGTYRLEVVADPLNTLRESDETDNAPKYVVILGTRTFGFENGLRQELGLTVNWQGNWRIAADRAVASESPRSLPISDLRQVLGQAWATKPN